MNTKEYKKIIEETAVYPQEVKNFGLVYCVLGIMDELTEVQQKLDEEDYEGAFTEKFDVVWYICALCKELNISFEDLISEYFECGSPKQEVDFNVFGIVKKFYRDDKKIIIEKFKNNFLLPTLEWLFKDSVSETDFQRGLEENYQKLLRRRTNNTIHGDGDKR